VTVQQSSGPGPDPGGGTGGTSGGNGLAETVRGACSAVPGGAGPPATGASWLLGLLLVGVAGLARRRSR